MFCGGVEAGGEGLCVQAVASEDCGERDADSCDVAQATHLGDEATAGAQGAVNTGEGGGLQRFGNPVERGVREDGVELGVVGKFGKVGVVYFEAASAGSFDHRERGVDSAQDCSGLGELLGECAVAASGVEDVLAGLGVEQRDDGGPEGCDEAAVDGVAGAIPGLCGV